MYFKPSNDVLMTDTTNKPSNDVLMTDATNYEEVGSTRDSLVMKDNPSYNVPAACFEVNQH